MKKLYLIALLLSICLTDKSAMAQDEPKEEKPQYIVEIDSQFIKATPYERVVEDGMEVERYVGGKAEWYTDMTIRSFLPKKADENGMKMMSDGDTVKPTIFLLSGGGFTSLDNQAELNPDNGNLDAHPNLKLATKLANEGYNVFWIDYALENTYKTLIDKLLFIKPADSCTALNGTEAKARMEHASLKSFRDFRVKFKAIINDPDNYVDTNNVFISGISARAVLTIYSVFLDGSEIPSSISFVKCSGGSPTTIVTIDANHALRKDGYPMPKIKGIIPMSGASFYDTIFTNNTTVTNQVAMNFMHGTCDELINQDTGRVSYKFLVIEWVWFINDWYPKFPFNVLDTVYNTHETFRYPRGYGSKHLYNLLRTTHNKVGFGQVIRGGHSPLNSTVNGAGGWDVYQKGTPSSKYNPRDIVFDNISLFMKRVMGEADPPWTNHAYSVFPDIPTEFCLTDDQTLLSPPIITVDTVCGTVAAALSNPPAWATITWSVSNKLQIVGSNTGTAIAYKGLSAGSGTLTASVDYGNGVVIPVSKNVVIPATCPSPCNGIFYFNNQNVSTNTSIIHCGNIHSQNITVNSGVSLTLDATGYVLIPNNFEVPVGATLGVNP
ncbi:MAG: hypothetical protein M9958_04215 [Chitinophagales bacterium]|nr:hypothetical protein [Chitinophagales bacterium]